MDYRRWLGVVVAALSLSGCGGGDRPSVLLEKWQRFVEGNPTHDERTGIGSLEGGREEVYRLTARRRVPQLIVETDECLPRGYDLEGVGSTGQHRRFRSSSGSSGTQRRPCREGRGPRHPYRGRRDISLRSSDLRGWLDHTQFRVTNSRCCTVGAPGCSGTDPDYEDGSGASRQGMPLERCRRTWDRLHGPE